MKGIKGFLDRLNEETSLVLEAEESKNLAREDALMLIATFVKDVKKKFSKKEDQLAILNSADKTLSFYINEIESSEADTSTSMSSGPSEFEPMEAGTEGDEVPENDVEVE